MARLHVRRPAKTPRVCLLARSRPRQRLIARQLRGHRNARSASAAATTLAKLQSTMQAITTTTIGLSRSTPCRPPPLNYPGQCRAGHYQKPQFGDQGDAGAVFFPSHASGCVEGCCSSHGGHLPRELHVCGLGLYQQVVPATGLECNPPSMVVVGSVLDRSVRLQRWSHGVGDGLVPGATAVLLHAGWRWLHH